MATEISSIGKMAAIAKLFEGSGLVNESPLPVKEKGECSLSQKVMVEGIDFDLVYTPLKHLGYKAVLYAIGDLYASLRPPVSLSFNLGVSKRFSYEDIAMLWGGMVAACDEHSIKHVSLDLNPSINGLTICMAACGVQKKGVLEKVIPSKNMDIICLSGHVGAAYMGLHILEREKVAFNGDETKQPDLEKYKPVLANYLSPEINPNIVKRFIDAEIYPSKGYFLTNGLAAGVMKLSQETGFGAKVYIDKIPISSQTFSVAEEFSIDAVTAAMNGGDDYRFIFTLPIEKHDVIRKDFQDFDIIGHLARPEVGQVLVTPEGAEFQLKAQGFTSQESNHI